MKKLIITSVAILFMTASAMAQQNPQTPVDAKVRIGKLENGLTYYIRHNAEPQGQANFYIAQKVGSILEEENQRGLAHFLEHMCFNGTKNFPGNGVIKYCESIGVKFGANLNAYTNFDETVYNIDNVPVADNPANIDSCLTILHDWADGLALTDEDIDHERGVIHEEWRTRSDAQIRLMQQLLPMMYPKGEAHARPDGSNRYGHRMPIGVMEVVDNFPYKALRDYYKQWYRTDLQGIVVVGDIDVDQIEAKIKKIFGTIAKPVNPQERYYVQVPDNDEPLICLAKDKEQPYALSMLFMKHDPYPHDLRSNVNYLVYKYALEAASRMINARLQEMLQNANPPFIQAHVADGLYFVAKTKNSLNGTVVCAEDGVLKAVTTLYREMLRAVKCGFTDSEYERAKASIMADIEAAYNSREKKSSKDYCKEYVRHFIDNEPIPSAEDELAMAKQISAAVNAEMVGKVMAKLVSDKNLVMNAMLPDKEGVKYPTEEEVAAALKAVAAEQLEPYQDAVSDEPLMSALPKPGKVKKTAQAQMGYKQYTLSNGATVYFRQTDNDPNQVVMLAYSRGGKSLYPETMAANLKALDEVMPIGGLGKFSKTELTKILAGRKLSVTPVVGLYEEYVGAKATPKDLETMLQVNYLTFTDMRSDNEAYKSWLNRQTASVANLEKDPQTALNDSVIKAVYTTPAYVQAMRSSDIAQLDYGKIMQIARERFANAADFTFVITGAVDEATLLPLIEQYIASLPAQGKREQPDLKAGAFGKGMKNNLYDRKMEVPMTTNVFFDSADVEFSLKNKLAFNLALNALSVELMEEIREKEGGTYGIGAYGDLVPNPAPRVQCFMQIPYQTNPDRADYLNQRVRDIVSKFVKQGPSVENLNKGKEFFLKSHKENLRDNNYCVNTFKTYLDTKVDLTKDFDQTLQNITVEDTRQIIEQMMNQKNHIEVIMRGVKE